MGELIFRFLVGGLTVSIFAALGDVLKPKSFAGLFGAAPSVGLATLALASVSEGPEYVAIEARSMMVASLAFLLYACVASRLMMRLDWRAAKAATWALVVWFAMSFTLWFAFLK